MVTPMHTQTKHDPDGSMARFAILNGVPIPAATVARLEARGVNVGELEQRIRQSIEWRH